MNENSSWADVRKELMRIVETYLCDGPGPIEERIAFVKEWIGAQTRLIENIVIHLDSAVDKVFEKRNNLK